jgi:transcriptional regulator of acetoin/glycerol metabolism
MLAPGPEVSGAALLALDADDLVIGATRAARLALGIIDVTQLGQLPAADLLSPRAQTHQADLAEAERGAIRRALARAEGNVSAAARALGLSRATLYRRMEKLGMQPG